LDAVGKDAAIGSYMVPGVSTGAERMSKEFVAKFEAGPRLVMTVMPNVNMGVNLGLTFLYFLTCSFLIGYATSIAIKAGTDFMTVFRLVFTIGILTFLAAMVGHSIWFRTRIVGHLIESIAYAAIVAAIFGGLWPK
jgi:hypothetical protein